LEKEKENTILYKENKYINKYNLSILAFSICTFKMSTSSQLNLNSNLKSEIKKEKENRKKQKEKEKKTGTSHWTELLLAGPTHPRSTQSAVWRQHCDPTRQRRRALPRPHCD
jgi:predicted RND superfamily exporter protein